MESVLQVIKQDFAAAVAAFEQDNFEEMNICANRLMGNALFGDSAELFLPGFFLKDVAGVFLTLKSVSRTVATSTAKTVGLKYIGSLKEYSLGEKSDLSLAWISFFQFYRDIRKFFPSENENKIYTDNLVFTRHSFLWLIKYMNENKEILLDQNNLFFIGILNEFERIFRSHSGELNEVLAISMVKALDRLYNYLAVTAVTQNGKIDKAKVETLIYPHIEQMEQLIYKSGKPQLTELTNSLWIITKEWRKFFIGYMEIARVKSIGVERAIEISPEMKKKLSESISKTFEKEVKPEGKLK